MRANKMSPRRHVVFLLFLFDLFVHLLGSSSFYFLLFLIFLCFSSTLRHWAASVRVLGRRMPEIREQHSEPEAVNELPVYVDVPWKTTASCCSSRAIEPAGNDGPIL